jgi:hypothetical protein
VIATGFATAAKNSAKMLYQFKPIYRGGIARNNAISAT